MNLDLSAAELELALIEDDAVPGAMCQVLTGPPEVVLDGISPQTGVIHAALVVGELPHDVFMKTFKI